MVWDIVVQLEPLISENRDRKSGKISNLLRLENSFDIRKLHHLVINTISQNILKKISKLTVNFDIKCGKSCKCIDHDQIPYYILINMLIRVDNETLT